MKITGFYRPSIASRETLSRALVLLGFAAVAVAAPQPLIQPGDLIAGGTHHWCFGSPAPARTDWYRPDGTFVKALEQTYATDLVFSPSGELYLADAWRFEISVFDRTLTRIRGIGLPEDLGFDHPSIALDEAGYLYVVWQASGGNLMKFDPAGQLIARWTLPSRLTSIDLAGDQCTLFHVGREDSRIGRFDVCAGSPLPPLPAALPDEYLNEVRLLDDGSILVAGGSAIFRVGPDGTVLRTYTVPDAVHWDAIAIDLDGGSFWASSFESGSCSIVEGKLWRLDLETGSILAGPYPSGEHPEAQFPFIAHGLAVFAGPRAAIEPPAIPTFHVPALGLLAIALAAIACARMRL